MRVAMLFVCVWLHVCVIGAVGERGGGGGRAFKSFHVPFDI